RQKSSENCVPECDPPCAIVPRQPGARRCGPDPDAQEHCSDLAAPSRLPLAYNIFSALHVYLRCSGCDVVLYSMVRSRLLRATAFWQESETERVFPRRKKMSIPLIFIHGSGDSSRAWQAQLAYFSQAHAIDLPGHGQRPDTLPASVSVADYAGVVYNIIRDEL